MQDRGSLKIERSIDKTKRKMRYLFLIVILFVVASILFNGGGGETNDRMHTTINHFNQSLDYAIEAQDLISVATDGPGEDLGFGISMHKSDQDYQDEFILLSKQALEESKRVYDEDLERVYRGMGKKYQDTFVKGHELFIEGLEVKNIDMSMRGQLLVAEWFSYYADVVDR